MLAQKQLSSPKQRIYTPTGNLALNLDSIIENIFYNRPLSKSQITKITNAIVQSQYQSGKYWGMFALTNYNDEDGMRLFTGEKLHTLPAAGNILMQEYARVLVLFDLPSVDVQFAISLATARMLQSSYSYRFSVMGEYAHSAVGFMRYLAVGSVEDWERRLKKHIKILSHHQNGNGRWLGFPFYYTLLALSEIDLPEAERELRYSLPACYRALRHLTPKDKYTQRRRIILERVLEKFELDFGVQT